MAKGKRRDMLSEGYAVHPVGCDSPLQIVMEVWRTLAHLFSQGAYSEQDSIQSIFLFISPLPLHASSGMVPVSLDEEVAGGVPALPSAFLTHVSTNLVHDPRKTEAHSFWP